MDCCSTTGDAEGVVESRADTLLVVEDEDEEGEEEAGEISGENRAVREAVIFLLEYA